MIRNVIPSFLKPAIRFLYYKQQRAKVFREHKIKKKQKELITQFDSSAKKIIIFFIGGADWDTGFDNISGGALSIVSLCEESKKLKSFHGAEVLMCTLPGQHLLLKHTRFNNNTDIFRFSQIKRYFTRVEEILLHIPEFLCNDFMIMGYHDDIAWLKKINKVHINIMNQNIKLMPSVSEIHLLKNYASNVTITTAHKQYCTESWRTIYGVPLHHFSTFTSPEQYNYIEYVGKENILLLSPDDTPKNDALIKLIEQKLPHIQTKVITGLTYDAYKQLIAKAKWTVTFGEGLDFYFIEPVFSGSVSFAIYNENFFTPEFKGLTTVYNNYEDLYEKIISTISNLDEPNAFKKYNSIEFDLCADLYSYKRYQKNIASFYKGEYTFA